MTARPRLVRFRPAKTAALRLFCFPHAGGSATAFRPWAGRLPAQVEVCALEAPGHDSLVSHPPLPDVPALVDALLPVVRAALDLPYALFGHCLGAVVAHDLCTGLLASGAPHPELLVVSGHRAPHLPDRRRRVHDLPDHAFVAALAELAGTPPEVLASPELLELFLPVLRADFRMCETYRWMGAAPVGVPIVALRGQADPEVTSEEIAAWRERTTSGFTYRALPGGHLYPLTHPGPLLALLGESLGVVTRGVLGRG